MNSTSDGSNSDWRPESALDVLLLLLYEKGIKGKTAEPIEGITRLDKILFLLSRSDEFGLLVNKGYNFEAYNYGPFAPEIFDDIETLKEVNIIRVLSKKIPKNRFDTQDVDDIEDNVEDSSKWNYKTIEVYSLTEEGKKIAKLLYNELSVNQKEYLRNIKRKFQKIPLSKLLAYVYNTYPESAEKSKIKNKYLR